MELLEKIHDICLGRVCDDCPFSYTADLECPFEEYPAGWNLEKIKEVINGRGMDELTVKETFNNLPEQLQNDIYFIMGITPDSYAKMVFNACMRLLVFRKD